MSDNRKFYRVDGKDYRFYSDAISAAILSRSDVIDLGTGLVRWTPSTVPADRQRRYQERLNAYNAQKKANS